MIKTINVILAITSVCALVWVYALKYQVEETAQEKVSLQAHIERQEGQLSLLQADWAALTQPGHIAPIVARHQASLDLAPIDQKQFSDFASLPMRPTAPDTQAMDALFEALATGVDPADNLTVGN